MGFFTISSKDLFNKDMNPTMRLDVPMAKLIKSLVEILDNNQSYTPESAMRLLEELMASSASRDKHKLNEFGQHMTITAGSKYDRFIQGLTGCTSKAEAVTYAREKFGFKSLTQAQEQSFTGFIENIIEYRIQAAQKRLDEQQKRINGLVDLLK